MQSLTATAGQKARLYLFFPSSNYGLLEAEIERNYCKLRDLQAREGRIKIAVDTNMGYQVQYSEEVTYFPIIEVPLCVCVHECACMCVFGSVWLQNR